MKISKSLNKNICLLKEKLKSQDIIYYQFNSSEKEFCLLYVDSITDKEQIGKLLLFPIFEQKLNGLNQLLYKVQISHLNKVSDIQECINKLLSGQTILFCDGDDFALVCDFYAYQSRAIAEPPTATVIRGPREGFTESIKTNISLIRRRIKVSDFIIEMKRLANIAKRWFLCAIFLLLRKKRSLMKLSKDFL